MSDGWMPALLEIMKNQQIANQQLIDQNRQLIATIGAVTQSFRDVTERFAPTRRKKPTSEVISADGEHD
jgi:hypothetical protein